jgi:sulfur-carrier protein
VTFLKLRYFAWVRERIGKGEEDVELPAEIATVGELMQWLASRGEEYADAFSDARAVRAAVDWTHVRPEAPVAAAEEIAFFPPMTGG